MSSHLANGTGALFRGVHIKGTLVNALGVLSDGGTAPSKGWESKKVFLPLIIVAFSYVHRNLEQEKYQCDVSLASLT